MPDTRRIEDLKRRVQKDPSSIAFAQLAEEYRRAGHCQQSVEVCQAGLAIHPEYLSARVTLGRALLELGRLEPAQHELEIVLKGAPENLAALRGLAEIHHRRGALPDALEYYRSALSLARNDPDLEQTVTDLERTVAPPRPAAPQDGLSLEQMQRELAQHAPSPSAPAALVAPSPSAPAALVAPSPSAPATPIAAAPSTAATPGAPSPWEREGSSFTIAAPQATLVAIPLAVPQATPERSAQPPLSVDAAPALEVEPAPDPERERALHEIDALEGWLAAINAARPDGQP